MSDTSEFAAIRSKLTSHRAESFKETKGVKEVILGVQTELSGLIRNIAKSNEDEVGAAVHRCH